MLDIPESTAGSLVVSSRKPALGWAKRCYGVDMRGDGRISIARAVRSGGRVTCRQVDDEPGMRAELAAGEAVSVGCLSCRESLTRWLEAPFASVRKAVRVLPALLDIKLPFAIEDCVYFFLRIHRTSGRTTRALSIVATEKALETKLRLLSRAGFDPLVLDQEGLAVWTQVLREPEGADNDSGQLKVVLVMEGDESSLVIGKGLEFSNGYSVSMDDIPRIVRLVRAQTEGGVLDTRCFLAGAGALDAPQVTAVTDVFSNEFSATSTVLNEPESFVARALAMRAMTAGALRCNFRSGRFAHQAMIRRAGNEHRQALILFLLAGLLLCGVTAGIGAYAARIKEQAAKSTAGLVDYIAGYHVAAKGEHAMGVARKRADERNQELAPFIRAFEPSLADLLSMIMNTAARNNISCAMISLTRDSAEISGVASEWNTIDGLAAVLTEAGYRVGIERKDLLADERVSFKIVSGQGQ